MNVETKASGDETICDHTTKLGADQHNLCKSHRPYRFHTLVRLYRITPALGRVAQEHCPKTSFMSFG